MHFHFPRLGNHKQSYKIFYLTWKIILFSSFYLYKVCFEHRQQLNSKYYYFGLNAIVYFVRTGDPLFTPHISVQL
jgi:hypothetical protein